MTTRSEDWTQFLQAFLIEAGEFIQSLEGDLLQLEQHPSRSARAEIVKSLFRSAHSLKGSALMFGFYELSHAAHALEDCFGLVRDYGEQTLDSFTMTGLLSGVDYLKDLLKLIQSGSDGQELASLALQDLGTLKARLETQFLPAQPDPVVAGVGMGGGSAVASEAVRAIFGQELPPLLQHMDLHLAGVQTDSLPQTVSALLEMQQQLQALGGMLQIPELVTITQHLRDWLHHPALTVAQIKEQGGILVDALHQLQQAVVTGSAFSLPVLASPSIMDGSDELDPSDWVGLTGIPEMTGLDEMVGLEGITGLDEIEEMQIEEMQISSFEADNLGIQALEDMGNLVIEPFPVPDYLPLPTSSSPFPQETASPLTPISKLGPAPSADPSLPAWSPPVQRPTIRVDLHQLNELVNLVGELVINRTNLELEEKQLRLEVRRIRQQLQDLQRSGQQLREDYDQLSVSSYSPSQRSEVFDPLEFDQYNEFHTTAQSVLETTQGVTQSATRVDDLSHRLEGGIDQLRRITNQLRRRVMQLRVVPFSTAVDHLPRALRDLSHRHDKDVSLLLLGRDTMIDESLVEGLRESLLHLVRNAFDHGIEASNVRELENKSASGQVEITARHQGGQIVITISDDGQGIDPERIRRKLVEKGLVRADQVQDLSLAELYEYLFQPGFSTASQVSDLSGRGVGLDVVRANLARVRGSIRVDSRVGEGTTFTLKLPLMLSITQALIVGINSGSSSGSELLALPLDAVEEILQVPSQSIHQAGQQAMLGWRDEFIRLLPLSEVLHYGQAVPREHVRPDGPVLILNTESEVLAVAVDRIVGQQEIVIKSLPNPLRKPLGLVGSTILGDGQVVHILDVDDLAMSPSSQVTPGLSQPIQVATPSTAHILIVDDSYSVRQLLAATLTRAHFTVLQAKDGQDAWEQLQRSSRCDLVIADIEMPRMDGYELLHLIKTSSEWGRIPVAMLTSRNSSKHRQLAMDWGASHYFTKPYKEAELLATIGRLLTTAHPLPELAHLR